jgi:hypothetical protein
MGALPCTYRKGKENTGEHEKLPRNDEKVQRRGDKRGAQGNVDTLAAHSLTGEASLVSHSFRSHARRLKRDKTGGVWERHGNGKTFKDVNLEFRACGVFEYSSMCTGWLVHHMLVMFMARSACLTRDTDSNFPLLSLKNTCSTIMAG